MTGWTGAVADLSALSDRSRARLDALPVAVLPRGAVLFQPGDAVKGYVIVLSGRVGVHLTGPTGREILLYEVTPGTSCIQSTLGLLGGEAYTAEGVVEAETRLVVLPRAVFLSLLDDDAGFRALVFRAFARRMQDVMQALETVAFHRVEERLAAHLLARAGDSGRVTATQQDLASAIGSAREVVSRKLEAMARRGWIAQGRGRIEIRDADALRRVSDGAA